jgi:hypothetical protein
MSAHIHGITIPAAATKVELIRCRVTEGLTGSGVRSYLSLSLMADCQSEDFNIVGALQEIIRQLKGGEIESQSRTRTDYTTKLS